MKIIDTWVESFQDLLGVLLLEGLRRGEPVSVSILAEMSSEGYESVLKYSEIKRGARFEIN
jgi:hypothetical protein